MIKSRDSKCDGDKMAKFQVERRGETKDASKRFARRASLPFRIPLKTPPHTISLGLCYSPTPLPSPSCSLSDRFPHMVKNTSVSSIGTTHVCCLLGIINVLWLRSFRSLPNTASAEDPTTSRASATRCSSPSHLASPSTAFRLIYNRVGTADMESFFSRG